MSENSYEPKRDKLTPPERKECEQALNSCLVKKKAGIHTRLMDGLIKAYQEKLNGLNNE